MKREVLNEAHVYTSRFYEIKDSLQDLEKAKKMAELEVRYETEKKEHAYPTFGT